MHRFEPGFAGYDSMREKAHKMFKHEMSMSEGKRGIHHAMSREQSDMKLPRKMGLPSQENREYHFKNGGHAKTKMYCNTGGMAEKTPRYSSGGTVYEREMVGERPSRKRPHINYESDMRGEHGVKMAMGGVGKIRHKEAGRKGSSKHMKHGKEPAYM